MRAGAESLALITMPPDLRAANLVRFVELTEGVDDPDTGRKDCSPLPRPGVRRGDPAR